MIESDTTTLHLARQFARAGDLAQNAVALVDESLRVLPYRQRVRLERLREVQQALANCFLKLSQAYSGQEAA